MKLDVSLGNYRMICPFMDDSYEIYGVYFLKTANSSCINLGQKNLAKKIF